MDTGLFDALDVTRHRRKTLGMQLEALYLRAPFSGVVRECAPRHASSGAFLHTSLS
jgi:hypothetical protein